MEPNYIGNNYNLLKFLYSFGARDPLNELSNILEFMTDVTDVEE